MTVAAAARGRSRYHQAMRRNPEAWDTYRNFRLAVRKRIEAGEEVWCAVCRKRIMYGTGRRPGDVLGLSIDHKRRYDDNDRTTWDASNLQPTHMGCNRRRLPGRVLSEQQAPAEEYSRW